MKIIEIKRWTVANGDVLILPLCNNEELDTVTGEVDIQTSTNVPFSVTASVDGEHYLAQKLVNMGTFDLTASVSTAGHYMIPATGLQSVKFTFTGAGNVFIKTIF